MTPMRLKSPRRKIHPGLLKPTPTRSFLNQSLLHTNNQAMKKAFGKQRMRKQQPLPCGRCQLCGNHDDNLFPDVLRACKKCCIKIRRNVNNVTIISSDHVPKFSTRTIPVCDICYVKSRLAWKLNPFMCKKCNNKIGRRARLGKRGFYD